MKKITSSIVAALAVSTFAFAGGDIAPVEPEVSVPEVVESTPGSFYVGLGYSYISADYLEADYSNAAPGAPIPMMDGEMTADSMLFLAGYNFNQYIGIEGRYTMNIGDLSADGGYYDTFNTSADISNIAGYVKLMYPIGALNVYGLLGYGKTTLVDGKKVMAAPPSTDVTFSDLSESGFQWGIGANYAVTDNLGIFVDYTKLNDGDDFDPIVFDDVSVDAISVGVTYTF